MKTYALWMAMLSAAIPAPTPAAVSQTAPADMARHVKMLVDARYSARGPGAAILVARGDKVLFRGAFGEADVERHLPIRPDAVFRLGSVTKQFTAAGILKLAEAGRVKLDDPLSKYVPGYPGGDGITVLQLLNHTSGVKNYTALNGYMAGPVQRDLSTAQMIDVFKNETPDFAPGTSWAYSNSGYVLAGAVIEAASGEAWYAYLDRVFFKPLGMTHTGYGYDPEFASQQVHGYSYDGDKLVAARTLSMTQPHGAGGLVSNVDDLLKWNRALHEGKLLQSATYTRMITPAGKAKGPHYGFGLFIDTLRCQQRLWHGGGIFGFVTSLSYIQGPDVTVIILENDDQDDDQKGGESADSFARRLAAVALGDPYPAMRPMTVDAPALKQAEGTYRFPGDVSRILRVVDGQLTAQRGTRGQPARLIPIATDDFLYPDGFNRIRLQRDASGTVTGVRFFANGDGEGEPGLRVDTKPDTAAGQVIRATLTRVVGTYSNEARGLTLKVFLEGETLLAQIAGQPPVTLRATSATTFNVEETGATMEFGPGDQPADAIMRQNGRELKLTRVPQ